jgi:hypothetical protein
VKPDIAAAELRSLVEEAGDADVRRSGPANERWKAKAEAVMAAALGPDSATLAKFRDLRYTVGIWTGLRARMRVMPDSSRRGSRRARCSED